MQCPRCEYQSQATTVQCPQCQGIYPRAVLEELGHLWYTQKRLDGWWEDGTLPARLAQRLLTLTDTEIDILLEQTKAPLQEDRPAVRAEVADRAAPPTAVTVTRDAVAAIAAADSQLATPVARAGMPATAMTSPAPAGATMPLGLRPPVRPQTAPARLAPPPPPPRPAKPPRPAFSWKQVGMYLLSERTLNALLGLGAFLILAAAFVISTVNPTDLRPPLHLAAMIGTTLVFYGAGVFVQQRLKLMRTGAALLAIGAAFIPLDVATLGRDIMDWGPQAVWLAASVVCLPLYLTSHLWLRDRAFALLTAVAGGSLVLSLTYPLGVNQVWGIAALDGLAIAYLTLAHRLRRDWEHLSWALFWTAQLAVPIGMAGLLALRFAPNLWLGFPPSSLLDTLGAVPGASFDYAVGAAWWLGVAFYALAARLFGHRGYSHAAAWALPVAYLITLTKAPFGAPWYGLCLAALTAAYLAFGRLAQRMLVSVPRPSLAQLLDQPVYLVGLTLSLVAGLWPATPVTGSFVSLSEALTLWLLVGIYASAARVFRHIAFRYAAAYLLPVALTVTVFRHASWLALLATQSHNLTAVGIAALAACYLLFGCFVLGMRRLGDRRDAYLALAREPIFQVSGLLTAVASLSSGLVPQGTFAGLPEIAALLAVALTYGAAAFLLGQRAWAYTATYLLPVASGLAMAQLGLDTGATLLGWAVLAAGLLVAAEVAARRTGEGGRPLDETAIGLGSWRSRFASPLFSAAYTASLVAAGIGIVQGAALASMPGASIAGLLLVVGLYAASSALRRTSLFLYAATWLFLLPFLALAAHAYSHAGSALTAPLAARLLALLATGDLALAFVVDRARGHYAKPIYLAAYTLAPLSVALALPDRAITVQTMGMALLGCIWSAALVHRGRHPSYAWLAERLCAAGPAWVLEAVEMLFQYLAIWLFPVWLLLLQSLLQPASTPADYGIVLALLAPLYAGLGLLAARIHTAYRVPWLLGAYALSALGPLAALPDRDLRMAALAVSIALYVASALRSRRQEWLWLAAALGPVLLLEALYRYGDPARAYGIALVALSLGYGALGLVVQRGGVRGLSMPLRQPIRPFALPFLATGQALCLLGLTLTTATGETGLVLAGYALGALQYACAAFIARSSIISVPLAITLSVVYVSGMFYSRLLLSSFGLGLLPGLAAFLAIGEVFRRTADAAGRIAERRGVRILDSWATPFNAILHLGVTVAFAAAILASGLHQALTIVRSMTTVLNAYAFLASDRHQALTLWGISSLYFALAALRRRPGPLYPALGVALVSYLNTTAPEAATSIWLACLVAPVWALLWLAHAIGRFQPGGSAATPGYLRWSGPAGSSPWAKPLLFWGVTTLAGSAIAGGLDVLSGGKPLDLAVTLAYLALLVCFSLLWHSRALVWTSIALAALACQEALALTAVPSTTQPVYWAGGALLAMLLGSALRRQQHSAARLWATPLLYTAAVASVLAIGVAVGNLTLGQLALRSLAATLAVTGIAAVGQGIVNRQVPLRYLGLGLLNGGVICELLFRHVGQPQAFVLPLGLTLLLAAFLEWRRGAAGTKAPLETVALVLLLGTSLVQACGGLGEGADRNGYDIFLLLESVAVLGLGAMLRWKRTFFAACAAIVADVCILLTDPLGALNTWYLVAIIGCAMIALVIFLEQRRQQIPLWIDEIRLHLEAWD